MAVHIYIYKIECCKDKTYRKSTEPEFCPRILVVSLRRLVRLNCDVVVSALIVIERRHLQVEDIHQHRQHRKYADRLVYRQLVAVEVSKHLRCHCNEYE